MARRALDYSQEFIHVSLPKDLVTKSVRRLQRPPAPTRRQLLGADREPPLSQENLAGIKAAAVLAGRYKDENEAYAADRAAREEAERDEERSILAEYDRRLRESLG